MPLNLSPQTLKRIDALCRSVHVSPARDEQIHRELTGHLHDKLQAYLSGEQKPSEADALLLVERHFGDIDTVARLLQNVHAPARTWLRRLSAIVIVYGFCRLPWIILFMAAGRWINFRTDGIASMGSDAFSAVCLSLIACWVVLHRWNRDLEAGRAPWFMRWPRWGILSLIGLVLLPTVAPYLLIAMPGWNQSLFIKLFGTLAHQVPMRAGMGIGYSFLARLTQAGHIFGNLDVVWQLQAVLWIWWLGKGQTLRGSLLRSTLAVLAWLLLAVVTGGELQENPQSPMIIVFVLFAWVLLPRNRRMPIALPA